MRGHEDETDSEPQAFGSTTLAILRMGDANCVHHLEPIARALDGQDLWVLRPLPRPSKLVSVTRYEEVPSTGKLWRVFRMLIAAVRLARRPEVGTVISFNGVPYGLIAWLAARIAGKPVHVGLVGTEAHQLEHRWYGGLIDRVLRRANLVTVPGPAMADELVRRGYRRRALRTLPHGVDLDTFVGTEDTRDIDVLFVGSFIATKQIDRIVSAIDVVRRQMPMVRATLVGDGPLRSRLEDLVVSLGLEAEVDFVGYQPSTAPFYRRARTVVIASKWEGFPFVLVEAMVSGAVPVATDVGSIGDLIRDGENGVILPSAEPDSISAGLLRVLGAPEFERSIRSALEASRDELGYPVVTDFWRSALVELRTA